MSLQKMKSREEILSEISTKYIILFPNGEKYNLEDIDDISLQNDSFSKLVRSKLQKNIGGEQSASIKEMQRLQWSGYESASDSGHLRYYPKGTLVYNLIKEWLESIARDQMRALPVKTPFIYKWDEQDLRSQAESFHDRLYYVDTIESDKKFVLRFGGDFGLFRMLKDIKFSYKQLPFRVYEYADSFRYNKRGEVKGLERGRAFSFFDIHSICADFEQGWDEYWDIFNSHSEMASELEIDYSVEFTIIESFFHQNYHKILKKVEMLNKPVLIELLSKPKHYWSIKHVLYNEDNYKFFNAQLDFENSLRYGITYIDKDGKAKGCTICHSSSGSIERWMFFILEKALKMEKPVLPLWVAPTQIRIIPINGSLVPDALNLCKELNRNRIRVDVDDRNKSLGWKIKESLSEWNPYYILFGEKEVQSNRYTLQSVKNDIQVCSIDEIIEIISSQTSRMPYISNPVLEVSKYPII